MRRAKGNGTIREYQPGKWVARITINGKEKALYGKSKPEVTKKLKDFKKKISEGLTSFKNISYSDFLDLWLESKKIELKPQSYYRLDSTVENHIRDEIGFYDVDNLTSDIIQEDVFRKKQGLSYSSKKKIYDALNGSLKYAQRRGIIIRNPMEFVQLPNSATKVNKDIEVLTDDEVKRFVEATKAKYSNGKPIFRNCGIFLLMLNTGLRIGDAYVKQKLKKFTNIFLTEPMGKRKAQWLWMTTAFSSFSQAF